MRLVLKAFFRQFGGMEKVPFSEWKKLDIRTARIESVEEVPGKDKLFKLQVDIGDEKRTVMAGIKQFYSREELLGKRIIFLANLEPKKIAGVESNGMILAVLDGDTLSVLSPEREMKTGLRVE